MNLPRFYAPWCGHCQNLKPAYEKAAKSLNGLAQVAAINCDEESNKSFCGGMGVQGFPTLKIIKPSKKAGQPTVEDYQGARTASGIIDAVKLAIPNHVQRISDKALDGWFQSSNDTAKAILFSEKGTTGALIKVLASEFINSIKFAQIRNKEAGAVEIFGVSSYPTLIVLPGGTKEPVKYDGSFSKDALKEFLSKYASPSEDSLPKREKQKPLGNEQKKKKPTKKAKSEPNPLAFTESWPDGISVEAFEDITDATSIILDDPSEPTASPEPIVTPEDAPKPVPVVDLPPPIPTLIEEKALQVQCLSEKTTTCILALLPAAADNDDALLPDVKHALSSLAELADKHVQRGGKLFPFYSIPSQNVGATTLRDALKLGDDSTFELIAVNSRRGWWRKYKAKGFEFKLVENWVDNIRFGEGEKGKLPDELIILEKEEEAKEESKEEVKEETKEEPKEQPEKVVKEGLVNEDEEKEKENKKSAPKHQEL